MEFPRRYRLVKVPGTDDIYDLEPTPGKVYEEGTFYNKANQLSDETAALLGGVETVNEALAMLLLKIASAKVEAINEALADGVQVEVGSYYGDGQDSKTIQIGFVPKAVIIYCNTIPWTTSSSSLNTTNFITYFKRLLCVYAGASTDFTTSTATRKFNIGNDGTFTINRKDSDSESMNSTGSLYCWIAIGRKEQQ